MILSNSTEYEYALEWVWQNQLLLLVSIYQQIWISIHNVDSY